MALELRCHESHAYCIRRCILSLSSLCRYENWENTRGGGNKHTCRDFLTRMKRFSTVTHGKRRFQIRMVYFIECGLHNPAPTVAWYYYLCVWGSAPVSQVTDRHTLPSPDTGILLGVICHHCMRWCIETANISTTASDYGKTYPWLFYVHQARGTRKALARVLFKLLLIAYDYWSVNLIIA